MPSNTTLAACITGPSPPIAPFGDPAHALPVLQSTLRRHQEEALGAAGLRLVSSPPPGEPCLVVGANTWFTHALIRRFLDLAPETGGRLRLRHQGFQGLTEPLQRLPAPGVHDIALLPDGGDWEAAPLLDLEPDLEDAPMPPLHPVLGAAAPEALPMGREMVHRVDHWSHLLRVNLLSLGVLAMDARHAFETASWPARLWALARLLLRARGSSRDHLAEALTRRGRGVRIHRTATVEGSVLGDGVEVGPYAVVRGSSLGEGARVEEHASVNLSVLGPRSRVARGAMVNLCLVMEGALLSRGGGWQASVFGRDSFTAVNSTILDLSFSGEVKVRHDGRRVPSGSRFLGAALGHRAVLGACVTVGYGVELPNDAVVATRTDRVLLDWPGDAEGVVQV